ncbi:hypothetical protein RZS08_49020, partial [Arthrospira platensis SPKY1]|nr:hypothetical protein [Arthrospira platensis SPKY1]
MAYSSQLAFAVPVGREPWSALAPDNSLMLRRTSDEHWYVRAVTTDFTYGRNWVQSVWQPCPSARIQTRIEVHEGIQTRYHTLWLEEACDVTEGGFAIP